MGMGIGGDCHVDVVEIAGILDSEEQTQIPVLGIVGAALLEFGFQREIAEFDTVYQGYAVG